MKFTPEMIKEQEKLVDTLGRQGINDALIKRQFDRLLEEQRRQLKLLHSEDVDVAIKKREKSCPDVKIDERHRQSECIVDNNDQTKQQSKLGPSSLIKIKMMKETQESRKKNNGLQEAEQAREIMKKFPAAKNRRGLNNLSIIPSDRVKIDQQQQQQQLEQSSTEPRNFCKSCCKHGNYFKSTPDVVNRDVKNEVVNDSSPVDTTPIPAIFNIKIRWPGIEETRTFGGFTYQVRMPDYLSNVPTQATNQNYQSPN